MPKTVETDLVARNSPKTQAVGEVRPYQFRFNGKSSATFVSMIVTNGKGQDVTDGVTSGSGSSSTNTVTTPSLESLRAGKTYRLIVTATVDGATLLAIGDVICYDPREV